MSYSPAGGGRRPCPCERLSPLLSLLAACLATACLAPIALGTAAHADQLRVVVTSKPAHSLVAAVMVGTTVPQLLVEGAASPHTYAMKPSDAAQVNRAAVLVRVSPALEPFTEKLVRALPRSVTVLTLAESKAIKSLRRRAGGAFEDKDQAGGHGHGGHTHAADSNRADPHIWLDPANAEAMVRAIATTLAAASPADAARFAANAERLVTRINRMTTEIADEMAPISNRPFLVLHDAYQYFERRFALRAIGSILVDPDEQPSARRLSALRRKVQGLRAVCLFAEPGYKPRIIASVIEGTTARTAVLDPEGLSLTAGPELYFELMRNLATSMRTCLTPAA